MKKECFEARSSFRTGSNELGGIRSRLRSRRKPRIARARSVPTDEDSHFRELNKTDFKHSKSDLVLVTQSHVTHTSVRRSDGGWSCAVWRRSEQRPGRGRRPGEDHQQYHREEHRQDHQEEASPWDRRSTTRSPGRSTRPPRHSGKTFAKIVDNAGGEDNDLKLRAMDDERMGRGNGGKTPFPLEIF